MLTDCIPSYIIDNGKISDPEIIIEKNCVYYPKNSHFQNGTWGIYNKRGQLILPAALGYDRTTIVSEQEIILKYPRGIRGIRQIETAIYGGWISLHYGHTILEFLPRLWYLKNKSGPSAKILVHCSGSLNDAWKLSWFSDLMNIIGINKEDLICPSETTLVDFLLIPEASFQINGYYSKAFTDFTNWIGDKIQSEFIKENSNNPIFLSKSRLKSGVINYENESEFCDELTKEGFNIIFPEELSLYNQISIFKSGNPICGMLGSNMHTSIFSRSPAGLVLNIGSHISESFYLLDKANNANFKYVTSSNIQEVDRHEGFRRTFHINNPKELAKSFNFHLNEMKIPKKRDKYFKDPCDIEFYSISHAFSNKKVVFNKCDGSIQSTFDKDSIYFDHAILCKKPNKNHGIIISSSSEGFTFSINIKNDRLYYIKVLIDEVKKEKYSIYSILNPENNLYLSIYPYDDNNKVGFFAETVLDWEFINLNETKFNINKYILNKVIELLA